MPSSLRHLLVLLVLAVAAEASAAQSRTFLFTYAATVTGLKPGAKVRVWLPVPPTNADQAVHLDAQVLPAAPAEDTDPQYGNRILYFKIAADQQGTVSFTRTYHVTRREATGPAKVGTDDALVRRYLKADALVPVAGRPLEEIESRLPGLKDRLLPRDPTAAARMLYEAVNAHMKYDKSGTGWGRGDALWACDNGRGNCTDFHSLFIALARARRIPAKFEIGFGLPEERGKGTVAGYHCWAKFRVEGQGWMPVDISEANKVPERKDYYFGNLTADRVAFSEGRDLTLVPKQEGPPLNFFVLPYVEVGGRPYPAEKVRTSFSFRDMLE